MVPDKLFSLTPTAGVDEFVVVIVEDEEEEFKVAEGKLSEVIAGTTVLIEDETTELPRELELEDPE